MFFVRCLLFFLGSCTRKPTSVEFLLKMKLKLHPFRVERMVQLATMELLSFVICGLQHASEMRYSNCCALRMNVASTVKWFASPFYGNKLFQKKIFGSVTRQSSFFAVCFDALTALYKIPHTLARASPTSCRSVWSASLQEKGLHVAICPVLICICTWLNNRVRVSFYKKIQHDILLINCRTDHRIGKLLRQCNGSMIVWLTLTWSFISAFIYSRNNVRKRTFASTRIMYVLLHRWLFADSFLAFS
jgi:hypothetical protein